jgi:TolB-like protein
MDTPRKLVAILAADIAGYSRLMGLNEAGTAKALREHRAAIDPILAGHGGRVFKTMGDGVLVEFPSIVAAVESALAVQKLMAERNADVPEDRRMLFRIGINVGDVLIEGDDILGDGVNVAARLEGVAEPGGICISDDSYRQVRGKLDVAFEDAGEQQLKNIARPVRVYRVQFDAAPKSQQTLPLPSKPSIAVLPFANMSGDPEQEYFVDGIVEDITTALSQFRQLFVIARSSSFTYKSRAINIKQVARELGVRYVLEGSVRKAAGRVRITAQLIDTTTEAHLWANRFDGALEDVFDLQDQVTSSVVGAIGPKLEQVEIERAKRKPTESLDAYDYYLRGMDSLYQWTREGMNDALALFHKATEIDPDFAAAYGMAAYCYVQRQSYGWFTDWAQEVAESGRLARRAAELGKEDAIALSRAAHVIASVVGDVESGAALIDEALALNPNLCVGWYVAGWIKTFLGEPEVAIEHLARALRLSPFDPLIYRVHAGIAYAHFFAGRHEEASAWAERAVRANPDYLTGLRGAAVSHAMAGRLDRARKLLAHMRELAPALRVSKLPDLLPFRRPADFAKWERALRMAGLPE